jgi:hypothetical protein
LLKLKSKKPDDYFWLLNYVFSNIEQSRNGIRFSNQRDFNRFGRIIKINKILPLIRWRAVLSYPRNSNHREIQLTWKNSFTYFKFTDANRAISDVNRFPNGLLKLHFMHEWVTDEGDKKNVSTSVLVYCCHLMAVMCGFKPSIDVPLSQ